MLKDTLKNFTGGMNQDLDKGALPKDSYLEARNFRVVTSEGLSSGSLENIQGIKVIHDSWTGDNFNYNGTDSIPSGQRICGSVQMRDTIVLFTTSNTGLTPSGGRSIIYKATVNKDTEVLTSLEIVYDDNANNSTGTLNFSIDNRIKAVARYETPDIQKVYWTDTYNHVRYIDIAKYNTTDGLVKTGANFYMEPDLLEFIPEMDLNKPYLTDMITGTLTAGTVQYAYQYFRYNGSETVFSPLSNTIHIVTADDRLGSAQYRGESDPDKITGKGCEITIDLDNSDKYNKIRIIRIHYRSFGAVPTITIIEERDIDATMSDVIVRDIGSSILGELTLDEFNLSNTELFSCEDIEIKENRLFAANIKEDEHFDITTWDARAVRFKQDPLAVVGGVTSEISVEDGVDSCAITYLDNDTVTVTLPNFPTLLSIPVDRTVTDVTAITFTTPVDPVVTGFYDIGGPPIAFSSTVAQTTIAAISYGGNTLSFTVSTSGTDYFAGGIPNINSCIITDLVFTYDYDTTVPLAKVYSSGGTPIEIDEPTVDTIAAWNTAGWTGYTEKHDGINYYNDPDNDYTAAEKYVYQSDGSTLGAEGPNIKISFTTEEMVLDGTPGDVPYSSPAENTATNKSFKSFASPFKSGKRSWQRDETYRLYVVFFNDRGLPSIPKWVCDLRMPSLHEAAYSRLCAVSGGNVITDILYPVVEFKSFPTDVISAQILRVARGSSDRSIITQGLIIPTDTGVPGPRPATISTAIDEELVLKLVSPEININKNISLSTSDHLDYLGRYSTVQTALGGWGDYNHYKAEAFTETVKAAADISEIIDIKYVTPSFTSTPVSSLTYINGLPEIALAESYLGCSGLAFTQLATGGWTADGKTYGLVNYKRNVFLSQYGGISYNQRIGNIAIPASDIITTTAVEHTCYNGDTFINYFDVANILFDLTRTDSKSRNDIIAFPVESSINCDLEHGYSFNSNNYFTYSVNGFLSQELVGKWENNSGTIFEQPKSRYQYNSVYSQDSTTKYYININTENIQDTHFDCIVRASGVKYNGEVSDSWTKFGVNETIEVNSEHGEIKALCNFNDKLLFWQENAFGVLSVNDRSLIQDNLTSKLALGVGGVLDRYDYLSTKVGINDKESIVRSQPSVYWYYDKDTSIYRFVQGIENVSKNKGMYSWFKSKHDDAYIVHGIYDRLFNEVIYTLYKPTDHTGYTIAYSEQVEKYTSFYDFVPSRYIGYNDGYLSVKYVGDTALRDYMFLHNSEIKPRAMFYSFTKPAIADTINTYDSDIQLLFNEDYLYTKVFDNLYYISNAINSTDTEVYNTTFDSLRAWNDYQNTHYISLVYQTNLERRERTWAIAIPRNAINTNYTSSPDIFDPANISATREFGERMRDKYLITELSYNNDLGYKFIVPFIGMKYRLSYR